MARPFVEQSSQGHLPGETSTITLLARAKETLQSTTSFINTNTVIKTLYPSLEICNAGRGKKKTVGTSSFEAPASRSPEKKGNISPKCYTSRKSNGNSSHLNEHRVIFAHQEAE